MSAKQVVEKSKQALESATSVRFKAKGTTGGQQVAFDVQVAQGKGAVGTIDLGNEQLKLIQIGETAYLGGNAALLGGFTGGQSAVGKWFKAPIDSPGLGDFLEITDLSKSMDTLLKTDGELSMGTPKVVNGQQTVAVVAKGSNGGTLYVAAEGEPYPLLIESDPTAKDTGTVTYTEYNKPVALTPPPAKDVIEIPKR